MLLIYILGIIIGVIGLFIMSRFIERVDYIRAFLTGLTFCWPTFLIEYYGIVILGIWYDPNISEPQIPWHILFFAAIGGAFLDIIFHRIKDLFVKIFTVMTTAGTITFFVALSIINKTWAHRGGWNLYLGFLHTLGMLCLLVLIDFIYLKLQFAEKIDKFLDKRKKKE